MGVPRLLGRQVPLPPTQSHSLPRLLFREEGQACRQASPPDNKRPNVPRSLHRASRPGPVASSGQKGRRAVRRILPSQPGNSNIAPPKSWVSRASSAPLLGGGAGLHVQPRGTAFRHSPFLASDLQHVTARRVSVFGTERLSNWTEDTQQDSN